MDDFEEWDRQYEARRRLERQYHTKLICDTVGHDGELLFEMLTLTVDMRFDLLHYQSTPSYKIVNHYVNSDITMGFREWLHCDDAPLICPLHKIGMYFPEIRSITKNDLEIVKLANKLYQLDLKLDDDIFEPFVYAYSLDFNSFVPINLDEIKSLKEEINFCKKYGLETEELEGKLSDYGLSIEELEGLI